ncbi:MAG: hypothetical protein HOI59_11040 [Nitrospina sp.]|jgi:hypothetical protein|nr:hypothetical protein [Nitrospina sp.]MBT5764387.1 hypothetical protein [Nitrospina sp.]MBT6596268.1 hypothetical protein [Nitrospina sp.]
MAVTVLQSPHNAEYGAFIYDDGTIYYKDYREKILKMFALLMPRVIFRKP